MDAAEEGIVIGTWFVVVLGLVMMFVGGGVFGVFIERRRVASLPPPPLVEIRPWEDPVALQKVADLVVPLVVQAVQADAANDEWTVWKAKYGPAYTEAAKVDARRRGV